MVRQSPVHRVRQPSQPLLCGHQGSKRQQIAELCQLKADTLTPWLRRWNNEALTHQLADAPPSGRRPLVSEDQKKR